MGVACAIKPLKPLYPNNMDSAIDYANQFSGGGQTSSVRWLGPGWGHGRKKIKQKHGGEPPEEYKHPGCANSFVMAFSNFFTLLLNLG